MSLLLVSSFICLKKDQGEGALYLASCKIKWLGNTNEVNKDRHLAETVQALRNIENHMARKQRNQIVFLVKFPPRYFYFMESRVIYEVIFPSHTIHFHGVHKKTKKGEVFLSRGTPVHFLMKAPFLSLPRPSPFFLCFSPPPSPLLPAYPTFLSQRQTPSQFFSPLGLWH